MRPSLAPCLLILLAALVAGGCGEPQPVIPPELVLAQLLGDLTEINYEEGVQNETAKKLADMEDGLTSDVTGMATWRRELVRQIEAYILPGTNMPWNTPMGEEFVRMPLIYLAPDLQRATATNQRGDKIWNIERLREYRRDGFDFIDLRLEFPNYEPFEEGVYEVTLRRKGPTWWISRMPMPMVRPERLLSYWLDVSENDVRRIMSRHDLGPNPLTQHPDIRKELIDYLDFVVQLPEDKTWDSPETADALVQLIEALRETVGYEVDTQMLAQSRDEGLGTWTVDLQRSYWKESPGQHKSRIFYIRVVRDPAGNWRVKSFPKTG